MAKKHIWYECRRSWFLPAVDQQRKCSCCVTKTMLHISLPRLRNQCLCCHLESRSSTLCYSFGIIKDDRLSWDTLTQKWSLQYSQMLFNDTYYKDEYYITFEQFYIPCKLLRFQKPEMFPKKKSISKTTINGCEWHPKIRMIQVLPQKTWHAPD